MVGTRAIVDFFARKPSRARRNAGMVRAITGLDGIGARFSRSEGLGRLALRQTVNLPRTTPCRQAGRAQIRKPIAVQRSGHLRFAGATRDVAGHYEGKRNPDRRVRLRISDRSRVI